MNYRLTVALALQISFVMKVLVLILVYFHRLLQMFLLSMHVLVLLFLKMLMTSQYCTYLYFNLKDILLVQDFTNTNPYLNLCNYFFPK